MCVAAFTSRKHIFLKHSQFSVQLSAYISGADPVSFDEWFKVCYGSWDIKTKQQQQQQMKPTYGMHFSKGAIFAGISPHGLSNNSISNSVFESVFFSPLKFSFSLVAHKARRKRFKTIIMRIFVWHLWKKNGVFSSTRRQNDAYKICTKKCIKERRWEREREATSQDAIQLSYRFHVYFKCTNIEKETGIKETHNDDYIFEGYSNVALICQLLRGR